MSNEEKIAMGLTLKSARDKANLTQEAVAHLSKLGVRTIQRAEREGVINADSLGKLCKVLSLDPTRIRADAGTYAEPPPSIQLNLREIKNPAALTKLLTLKASFVLAPEGEDKFNLHLANNFLAEIGTGNNAADNQRFATQALAVCRGYRYGLYGIHYLEKIEFDGKKRKQPCVYLIAARDDDRRIRKTGKGKVFEYLIDSRRQLWHRLTSSRPGLHEWIQNQLIKRCGGPRDIANLKKYVEKQLGCPLPDSMFQIDRD